MTVTMGGDAPASPSSASTPLCEQFTATCTTLVDPGFTLVMNWLQPESTPSFSIHVGDKLNVVDCNLVKSTTSPPGYLTESELITLMEKHGIGTDASIPMHINNICERNFVSLGPNRTLRPEALGTALIHGYRLVDPELCLPTMRARMERQLDLVAKGKVDYMDVVEHALRIFRAKFVYFTENIGKIDQLFESKFSIQQRISDGALSRCGRCSKYMQLFETRPKRLYCPSCEESLSLPTHGDVKKYMGRRCPYDDYELLLFSTGGKDGICTPFCPFCYNHPPSDDVSKGMTCSQCRHPTCRNSMMSKGVAICPENSVCGGTLVFQPITRPNWRLCCSHCNYIIKFATGAHNVSLVPVDDGIGDIEELMKYAWLASSNPATEQQQEEKKKKQDKKQDNQSKQQQQQQPKVKHSQKKQSDENDDTNNDTNNDGVTYATCGLCDARIFRVNFNINTTPFTDGSTMYQGMLTLY